MRGSRPLAWVKMMVGAVHSEVQRLGTADIPRKLIGHSVPPKGGIIHIVYHTHLSIAGHRKNIQPIAQTAVEGSIDKIHPARGVVFTIQV